MTWEEGPGERAEEALLLEALGAGRLVPWIRDGTTGQVKVGVSSREVIGVDKVVFEADPDRLRTLLHPRDRRRFTDALVQARNSQTASFEAALVGGGGQSLWTRWKVRYHDGRWFGVIQDMSEAHEIEAQVLQNQKLESLGTLLSGVTHDFNNLLMAILGFSEVLGRSDNLSETQRVGLSVIQRAASRGQELVQQLLRFSRRADFEWTPVKLNEIVLEAQALFKLPVDGRIDVQVRLGEDLPDVCGDGAQLRQVVLNLCNNAREAIPGSGRIELRTGLLAIGEDPPAGVYVEVEDNGIGMSREIQARMYEPFFTTKEQGNITGLGLGLAVVHGIVQSHGGRLSCHSQPGRGTTFRVVFPQVGPGASLEERLVWMKRRFLVVVSQEGIRTELGALLSGLGHEVVYAQDALETLQCVKHEHVDGAFVECGTGEWDMDVVRLIRRTAGTMPLIALLPGAESVWPGEQPPAAILTLPLQARAVLDTLERVLG